MAQESKDGPQQGHPIISACLCHGSDAPGAYCEAKKEDAWQQRLQSFFKIHLSKVVVYRLVINLN